MTTEPMSEPTLYRERWFEEWPRPIPDDWIYAGNDDEFGILDRFMVPVERCDLFVGTTSDKDAKIHRIEWCSGAGIGDNDDE